MKSIISLLFLVVLLFPVFLNTFVSGATVPNVLLILTDDQGYGDITRHGNSQIKTPHLDQIAKDGAYCEHFFVSPVCSPTRASILTGRYHLRTGVHDVTRGHETMRSDEITVAEVLKSNGYKTAAFGKWHNGSHFPEHPLGQGFEHFTGFCAGHWNNYVDSLIERDGKPCQTKGFLIDVLTNSTIDFIKDQKDHPWFAYVAFNTPHTPWQVPDGFYNKEHLKNLKPETRCAYAMVENIDENVGRLLKNLVELHLKEKTIVIFMTDNGANSERYNAGMRGRKGSAHEGGNRVPMFISYPEKIKPGTVVKGLSMHIDLLPTLVELTQSRMLPGKAIDGISLASQLTGQSVNVPDRKLYTEWGSLHGGQGEKAAVRTSQYRAVKEGKKEWMLFDMNQDPGEEHDLSKEKPELLALLKQDYDNWYKDVTRDGFDPIPIQLGIQGHPIVHLPAHEAILHKVKNNNKLENKGIQYFGEKGFANDWISGWDEMEAYASWPIKVVSPGTYIVKLEYGCTKENEGCILCVKSGDTELKSQAIPSYIPTDLPNDDRIDRKEVREKQWKIITLGEIKLTTSGKEDLILKCIKMTGKQGPEVKSLSLEKVP